jgi:gas vesicle protein
MTESRQENKALPFIGGMLIGAVVAAMFAPRKGEEMRMEVKNKAKEMKEKLDAKKSEMKNKKDKLANKADEKIDESQERLEQAKKSSNSNRGTNL